MYVHAYMEWESMEYILKHTELPSKGRVEGKAQKGKMSPKLSASIAGEPGYKFG